MFQISPELICVKNGVITFGVGLQENVSPQLLIEKVIIRHLYHYFGKIEGALTLFIAREHFGHVSLVSEIVHFRVEINMVLRDVGTINCHVWIDFSVRVVPNWLFIREIPDILLHVVHGFSGNSTRRPLTQSNLLKATLLAQLSFLHLAEETGFVKFSCLIYNIFLDEFGKLRVFISKNVVECAIVSLDKILEFFGDIWVEIIAIKVYIE